MSCKPGRDRASWKRRLNEDLVEITDFKLNYRSRMVESGIIARSVASMKRCAIWAFLATELGAEWVDPSLLLRVLCGSMLICRRELEICREPLTTVMRCSREILSQRLVWQEKRWEPWKVREIYLNGRKVNYCFFGQHSEVRIRSLRSEN